MAELPRAQLEARLRLGDSSANRIATQFLLDFLDSTNLKTDTPVTVTVLDSYTVTELASYAGSTGEIVYVSDGTLPIAVYDGSEWVYTGDGSAVNA